jgi:hydroxyacylglutathione hydrolase
MEQGVIVIDASESHAFGGAHIKGSYSIWLEGLPMFAGWVLPYGRPILLVWEDRYHLERAVRYLVRLGYDSIQGYLKGEIAAWYNAGFPVEHLPLLTVHELRSRMDSDQRLVVLDVRRQDEWDEGHIKGAQHIYVGHLEERIAEVSKDKPTAVLCRTGHRASLGASILLRAGYREVYNVLGSMMAWRAAGYPITTE